MLLKKEKRITRLPEKMQKPEFIFFSEFCQPELWDMLLQG